MLGDVAGQFGGQTGPAPGGEKSVRPQLHCLKAQFLQPETFVLDPGRAGQVGVGRPAPQGERLAEARRRVRRPAGGGQGVLETVGVHRFARQTQQVSGPLGDQDPRRCARRPVRFDGTAQRGDEGAQCADGAARRVVPQVVDQGVGGDHAALGGHEPAQHLSVAWTAEADRPAVVVPRLYRAEHLDPHAFPPLLITP